MFRGRDIFASGGGTVVSADKVLDRRTISYVGTAVSFSSVGVNILHNGIKYPDNTGTNLGVYKVEQEEVEEIRNGITASTTTSPGYVATTGTGRTNELGYFIENHSIDRSLYPDLNLSYITLHNATGITHRIAIMIAGQWYCSLQSFPNAIASTNPNEFPTKGTKYTFPLNPDNYNTGWSLLTVIEGTSVSRATSATPLPAGIIQKVAPYMTSGTTSNAWRWMMV